MMDHDPDKTKELGRSIHALVTYILPNKLQESLFQQSP